MGRSTSVFISGPVFSFMFYDLSRNSPRQYGFLIGDIIEKEDVVITDQEQQQVNVSTIIKITSTVTLPNRYISKGRVNEEQMRKLLGSNFSKVVGWYKSEPNPIITWRLKEILIHKQFEKLFTVSHKVFLVCNLVMDFTKDLSIFSFRQAFTCDLNNTTEVFNICIPNLGELDNVYKSSQPVSQVFSEIVSQIDVENSKGVTAVTEMGNALQDYMEKICKDLIETEQQLFKLEKEVNALKFLKTSEPDVKLETSNEEVNDGSDNQCQEIEEIIDDHLETNKMTLGARSKVQTSPDSNKKMSKSDLNKGSHKANVKNKT